MSCVRPTLTHSSSEQATQSPFLLELTDWSGATGSTRRNDHAAKNVVWVLRLGRQGSPVFPRVVKTTASVRCAGEAEWKPLAGGGEADELAWVIPVPRGRVLPGPSPCGEGEMQQEQLGWSPWGETLSTVGTGAAPWSVAWGGQALPGRAELRTQAEAPPQAVLMGALKGPTAVPAEGTPSLCV